jgi:3D (Asp-Asp-Asp) domain-containing protein
MGKRSKNATSGYETGAVNLQKRRTLLRSAAVDAPLRRVASILFVAAVALTAAAVLPAAGGSQTDPAAALRRDDAALASKSRSAVLELYALETRLGAAQARLGALRSQAAGLARERAAVSRRLEIARTTLRISERLLGTRLRALYERGEADPLAVVLGAESLEDAMAALDGLALAAEHDRAIMEQTRTARNRLAALSATLRTRGAEVERLVASAAAEAATLGRARAERAAYVEQLAAQRRLTAARIGEVEAAAAAAHARAQVVAATAPKPVLVLEAPDRVTATASGAHTLTVTASGYALTGATATGVPVGWGVVAVDPSVIPLGTHMTIPGYGEGVAADTGGAVQGNTIDLWFPSDAEARAWGRRTVTITLN